VIVDLGTGDGRAVLARAAAERDALVIGIDANAAAMAESSRRAARGRGAQRLANAWFAVESAEALPGPLARVASTVTGVMPWGSLLRGVLGLDDAVLRGIASIVSPAGCVEILASVTPSDAVDGLTLLDGDAGAVIASAWAAVGFELVSMRRATVDDLRRTRSSWARRLGDRPVWRIELARRHQPGPRHLARRLQPGPPPSDR
jgi:16S rRNA (adenine(1408)-N(1))-methyltransferase